MKMTGRICGVLTAVVLFSGVSVWGQGADRASVPAVEMFYFANTPQMNDQQEILTTIRNVLDSTARIYIVTSRNAIAMRGTPEQVAVVRKMLTELDRPKKTYRLRYTVSDIDGGKRIGVQHFDVLVTSGARTVAKQGSRLPVVTGAYDPGTSTQNQQVTYLDVGFNVDATLEEANDALRLRSKVERSSVAEEISNVGKQDPVIRQTMLEGTVTLKSGKPVMLGSLDVVGSTRHQDVEVMAESVQ